MHRSLPTLAALSLVVATPLSLAALSKSASTRASSAGE